MDDVDRRLLALLKDNARLSMAELGRSVGLSRTATLARVRSLEETGAIRGYSADVAVSPGQAHVARVGIVVKTPDPQAYIRRLLGTPGITETETVAGEYDLLVRVAAATSAELDDILDRINGWRETVRTTSFVVLKTYLSPP